MSTFSFEAHGIKQAQVRLNRLGAAVLDATPAFEEIASLMMRVEAALFDSGGRRGGGSWKRDSVAWAARKARNGMDPRVNHATLALRQSVTVPGDDHQVLEITPQTMRFGSALPYSGAVQKVRPFIKTTAVDRANMRDIIRDHLITAWETARA